MVAAVNKLVTREPDCGACFDKYDFCVEVSLECRTHMRTT
jgi:hypothetical protein